MNKEQSKHDFNFFKFLKLERKESISSQFIVSLLKEDKDYLKTFLQIIGYPHFIDINKCTIATEVTLKNRTTKKDYGRADIWIGNKENGIDKRVIIENKLFAREQYKQIIRYRQYLEEDTRTGLLFFLTLEEKPASSFSAKISANIMLSSNDATYGYQMISYQNHIIPWLNEIEKTANHGICELIRQYKIVIDEFTFIQRKILSGDNISDISDTRKVEFNAGLELYFWNYLEQEIEIKSKEDGKNIVFDSRRKFNFDKIFKHQKNQSFGNSYGLISGHLRFGIKVIDGNETRINITNGSFNSTTGHWDVCDNRDYTIDVVNLKKLENIYIAKDKAIHLAEMFCNMY